MRPCEISLLLPCWSHFLYFLPLLTLHRPLGRSWNILGLFLSVHWFLSFFSRCSERCPTPRKHPTDTHWISKEWINCLVWSTNSSQSIPKCENESCSVLSDSLLSLVLYSPWNSPGQNTGVGSRSLLHRIFLTQESNRGLLHCRWILYQITLYPKIWSTQENVPHTLEKLMYFAFLRGNVP